MKITATQILAIGAVGIAGVVVWRAFDTLDDAVDAVGDAVDAVNPVNNDNVIARGYDYLIGAPGRGSSLGSDFFDFVERLRGRAPFDPTDNALSTDKLRDSVTS